MAKLMDVTFPGRRLLTCQDMRSVWNRKAYWPALFLQALNALHSSICPKTSNMLVINFRDLATLCIPTCRSSPKAGNVTYYRSCLWVR